MAINLHQINEHEKKKAAQQAEVKPDMTQPMAQPSSGLAQGVDKSTINNPALDESLKKSVADNVMSKPMEDNRIPSEVVTTATPANTLVAPEHNFNETADMIGKRDRINYVRGFNTWADAEKAGDVSQQEWITQRINQMVENGQNPGEYETLMSLMGSAETPDEIKKRERRNALGETFRNLGNLIGNAANLYYTNKGGQYIDLNTANEKHRERMQRLKDKQDALAEKRKNILINAKLGDLKAARAEKAKKEEREYNEQLADKKFKNEQTQKELQYQRDLAKLEIQNAYRMGQIDAQTAARMQQLVYQATTKEALETLKHGYRTTENEQKGDNKKSTFTYGGKEYNKKDLAAMKELAKRLKKEGYAINMPKDTDEYKVKRDDFIKAILDAQKTDGVTTSYELVDSDILNGSGSDVIKYVRDEEEELEEWE
jgi:hypothetical protein